MPSTFLISDTHFGHALMVRDNNRPWDDVDEMNEALIDNWNKTVKDNDVVYHLGDVVMNRRYLAPVMSRLNGRKKLIKGNHDLFRLDEYLPWFEDILGCKPMHDMMMTHIPIHTQDLGRFKANIHGHLHQKDILIKNSWNSESVPDNRYFSVCVEKINYTPINYDEVRNQILARGL
jgi:calcineurin-like phosphoesterase family protein